MKGVMPAIEDILMSHSPFCIALVLFGTVLAVGSTPRIAVGATTAPVAVTTYHYDNLRTGWDRNETTLTASSFPSNFGILQTVTLDDQVDAQPLIVPGLTIAGGTHDVVYVATESNTVYAIDASSGAILLSRNLGVPVPTPLGCYNNGPNVGINGTPVINLATQTLYVMAYVNGGNGAPPTYQLHALKLSSLLDQPYSPLTVTASHTLTNGSIFKFNATYQRQRPALLLNNGINGNNTIYAAFGSFCDYSGNNSRGWILGWNANTLAPLSTNRLDDSQATSPNNFFLSAIWMSGWGIASTGPHLYFSTGNSDPATYDGVTNIQESVVQLNTDLSLGGIFTPSNHAAMDGSDDDLGSGGVLLLPDQSWPIQYVAITAGKDGRLFVLNRLGLTTALNTYQLPGCWCGPSYFVGPDGIQRIVTSHGSAIQTWLFTVSPTPNLTPVVGTATIPNGQDPGFFTVVSSNGTQNGTAIIWAVSRPTSNNPALVYLYAFAALAPTGTYMQLFSSPAGTWPNTGGNANIVPVVANGKVYVASHNALTIFGVGGPAAKIASKATFSKAALQTNPVAAPASSHLITGTLQVIDRSTLTLQTRTGKSVKIDDALAVRNQRVGVPLRVGIPLTVQGSMIEGNGALQATSIVRAKGSTGEVWPSDR
jgi:hypothetical protein